MAKHISDFSKLPDEIVFDLINEQNGTTLTAEDVTLGQPQPGQGWGNTSILITAVEGSDYDGYVTLGYNRLDVQGFLYGESLTLTVRTAFTIADLIPTINTALKINLTADDFIDGPVGPWQGTPYETKDVVIQMSPSSLVFTGELALTVLLDEVPLSTVLVNRVLSGLTYQPPA